MKPSRAMSFGVTDWAIVTMSSFWARKHASSSICDAVIQGLDIMMKQLGGVLLYYYDGSKRKSIALRPTLTTS
jgi:hypothetical protein